MTQEIEQPAGRILVVTDNEVARGIAAIAEVAGRAVTVLADQAPEGTPRRRLADHPPTPRDAVVVADHDAPEAYDILRDALRGDAGYVAMLASRHRTATVLAMLTDEGADEATLDRLHLPAGLNTGGKTPGAIALSVVAEIVAWSNGRNGRPMRDGVSPEPGPRTGQTPE